MKILQIAPAWIDTPPKDYGGTEWVINNLVKGLVTLGHEVTLFATKKSKSAGSLKYIFPKSLLEQNIPWTAALPSLLHYHQAFREAGKYDLVHTHLSSGTDVILLPLLADLSHQHIAKVVTVHGHWPFDRFSKMDSLYLKYYAKKITAISISQAMEKYLPSLFIRGGFVHNSLDTTTLKFQPKPGKYLTWLGKIIPDKGVYEAIQAAKMAGEQLIFAGIVDKFQERSVRYFEKRVKPWIDGKQIIFLGPADLKLKNKMLGGAKGFLNPINWEEPFGMVMVESMACGTPVISFARGAAVEIIKDQQTGFLVSTLKEMVAAISKLESLSRHKVRKHIEDNFSPVMAAKKYLQIYQKEIEKNKKDSLALSLKTRQRYFLSRQSEKDGFLPSEDF